MLVEFFGRLHPLVVHLPIGILILAFVFESLSFYERHARLRRAVRPTLLIGFVAAVVACLTGFFLKDEGGYNEKALGIHQFLGLTTTALTAVVFYVRKQFKTIYANQRKRKLARISSLFVLIITLSVTGHYGGTLTHGDDYLSLYIVEQPQQPAELSEILTATNNHDSLIFYQDVIHPLLASRCFSCHSASKQKGSLRLDQPEFILKGGKQGKIVIPGLADSSSLFTRLLLPLDDDHHMPPNEKPQLSSTDIALIQTWIDAGADFEQKVSALPNKAQVNKFLTSYTTVSDQLTQLPDEEIEPANEDVLDRLRKSGIIIVPVNSTSNYLQLNFTNARTFQQSWLDDLKIIKSHVVWVDLSYSTVTANDLSFLDGFQNLRYLYLKNTSVNDASVAMLRACESLVQINFVGTEISDQSLTILTEMKNLRKVFLFDTKMTEAGIATLKQNREDLQIDTGNYKLPKLVTDTLTFKRKSS